MMPPKTLEVDHDVEFEAHSKTLPWGMKIDIDLPGMVETGIIKMEVIEIEKGGQAEAHGVKEGWTIIAVNGDNLMIDKDMVDDELDEVEEQIKKLENLKFDMDNQVKQIITFQTDE